MNRSRNSFANAREVAGRLGKMYRWHELDNKDDPFEELVYIVLATRTTEEYYQRTFKRVKQVVGHWNRLPKVSVDKLRSAIGEAGLAQKKARALKRAATQIQKETGSVSLDFLRNMNTREAENFLLKLHGVGPKTAKCILMYSLERRVFPVDTHCVRVGNRLGWFDTTARRFTKAQMRRIEEQIPPDLRKPLHIRLVQHGRSVCTKQNPKCGGCPLTDMCDYYRTKNEA